MAVAICGAAFAQEEKPPMDLPVYPGAETAMEVNMSNEDILPMAKAMLPMLSGKLGPVLDKIDIDKLGEVLKDVKQIEMVQMDINNTKVKDADIANYYAKNMPSGQWTRVFRQSDPKLGAITLYMQAGIESIYGYRIRSVSTDGKPAKRVEAIKIVGKIDYMKLLQVAGEAVGISI